MFEYLWDAYQQTGISTAQAEAGEASRTADRSQNKVDLLERRVERLALLSQAMWELLSENTQITNNDLVRRVLEVDKRDGSADGKMAARVIDCPKCKNKVNSRRPVCIVCGSTLATKQPFEI
jgi:predicted hydrocarbon binding protein